MNQGNVVKIGDYDVFRESFATFLSILQKNANNDVTTSIVTINPEIYLHSLGNNNHAQAIKDASFVIADGMGMVWAAEYFSLKRFKCKLLKFFLAWGQIIFCKKRVIISQRITGVDLTLSLCAVNILPIKIFGSVDGSGQVAKKNLLKMFPDLRVEVFEDVIVKNNGEIVTGDVEILCREKSLILLALGAPKQELVMQNIKNKVVAGSIIIGVGGTIDFISGRAKRAPKVFRKLGIEWLYRLFVEPRRIKRIFNALIVFPYKFIKKY